MIRHLLAAGSLIFLAAVGSPCSGGEARSAKGSTPPVAVPHKTVVSTFASPDAGEIPAEIRIRSAVGEVTFLHRKHIEERSMKCVDCHHQINARKLDTPHPHYLTSSWINCKTCHNESQKPPEKIYACSACHRANPRNIADETLSPKVVIHKQCGNCHQSGTGKEASASCRTCHTGKKAL